jgi:predicted NUDIX family phosphoesterase
VPEKVLVFPAVLLKDWGEQARGPLLDVPTGVGHYTRLVLGSPDLSWMDRDAAEADPSFKQVIPYCVLRSGGLYFTYRRRKGGDGRLRGLRSLGVGGHINPVDGVAGGLATYRAALARELLEEVGLEAEGEFWPRWLIHDDRDEVGRVHFGLCHLVDVPAAQRASLREDGLCEAQYADARTLLADASQFEGWSRLLIEGPLRVEK